MQIQISPVLFLVRAELFRSRSCTSCTQGIAIDVPPMFSDLEKMVRWNVAATTSLPRGNADKFDLTTPSLGRGRTPQRWIVLLKTSTVSSMKPIWSLITVGLPSVSQGRRLHGYIHSQRRSQIIQKNIL